MNFMIIQDKETNVNKPIEFMSSTRLVVSESGIEELKWRFINDWNENCFMSDTSCRIEILFMKNSRHSIEDGAIEFGGWHFEGW